MRKKQVVVLNLPGRRPGRALRLSREAIRTLTAEQLSGADGGAAECPTTTSRPPDD